MADKPNTIPLHQSDEWLFTVEVRKTSQGPKAFVVDHRASLTANDPDPGHAMLAIGDILEKAVAGLKADAKALRAAS